MPVSSVEVRRSAYHEFLKNPQVHGVWCLRAYFDDAARRKIDQLLNLSSIPGLSRRLYNRRYREVEDPPLALLRLFAYLRSSMPRKEREGLSTLISGDRDRYGGRLRFRSPTWRNWGNFEEVAKEPSSLGKPKQQLLAGARKVFVGHFGGCTVSPVPQNPSRLDFVDRANAVYFQATEDPSGAIRVYSPHEDTVQAMQQLLGALPEVSVEFELTRQFSPEDALMEMYVPMLTALPIESVLWDKRTIQNTIQALDDLRDERFVHAIRASGIAVEELLVEIYETYLREKAPEVPLGSLLTEFSNRTQEILQGSKKRQEIDLAGLRKDLGRLIEAEKKKPLANQELVGLIENIQKFAVPLLDSLKGTVSELRETTEELVSEKQKLHRNPVFPLYAYRCLSGLIPLRNRVSHRVEKSGSVSLIGYVEAAVALRAFVVLATWWQRERTKIDYKADKKVALQQTVERSRSEG